MPTFFKTQGRTLIVEQIAHAVFFPDLGTVYPIGYHSVQVSGEDRVRLEAVLKQAGFIGEDTLINPNRLSIIEDAGSTIKLFFEGSDRSVHLMRSFLDQLDPTPQLDVPVMETLPDAPSLKKARSKKEETK